jgi:hypothetical protein
LPEERCPNLRRTVFKTEVKVAGGGPREVRYLAFDPEPGKSLFEQVFDLSIELTDSNRTRDGVRLARIIHARQYIGPRKAFAEIFMRVQLNVYP